MIGLRALSFCEGSVKIFIFSFLILSGVYIGDRGWGISVGVGRRWGGARRELSGAVCVFRRLMRLRGPKRRIVVPTAGVCLQTKKVSATADWGREQGQHITYQDTQYSHGGEFEAGAKVVPNITFACPLVFLLLEYASRPGRGQAGHGLISGTMRFGGFSVRRGGRASQLPHQYFLRPIRVESTDLGCPWFITMVSDRYIWRTLVKGSGASFL